MATNEAWGKELRRARHEWQERHGRKLPHVELGALVAERVQRPAPFTHPAVAAWYAGTIPAEPDVVAAIIQVLEGEPERFRAALVSAYLPPTEPVHLQPHPIADAMETLTRDTKKAPPKQGRNGGGKRSA